MNSMCFETFESARTTVNHDRYKGVSNEFEVLNLFKPLVNQDYKVVSHDFDVFRKV